MAIHYVTIKGRIKDGKLEDIHIPSNTPDGDVEIHIPAVGKDSDNQLLTEDFIFEAIPSDQLIVGGWEDVGITDSVEWVTEMRRKQREERQ